MTEEEVNKVREIILTEIPDAVEHQIRPSLQDQIRNLPPRLFFTFTYQNYNAEIFIYDQEPYVNEETGEVSPPFTILTMYLSKIVGNIDYRVATNVSVGAITTAHGYLDMLLKENVRLLKLKQERDRYEVNIINRHGDIVRTEYASLERLRLYEITHNIYFQGFIRDDDGVIIRKDDNHGI